MKVLKFGGTSVGSAKRMKEVASLITDGQQKIVVLSAMSGTTNTLVEIADYLYKKNPVSANEVISQLEKKYAAVIDELYTKDETKQQATACLKQHFELLRNFTKQNVFLLFDEKIILAQGELMSTAMVNLYLQEIGRKSALLPALDFMRIDKNNEPDTAYIREHLNKELAKLPADTEIYITQGFICRNAYNEIDNLQRGGSDYSASLIGMAIDAERIEIWTDVDGVRSADPRTVENTKYLEKISFEEAAEMAHFGAKVLHPLTIEPAVKKNIPIYVLNSMNPSGKGTAILRSELIEDGVKSVSFKENIRVINIFSMKMINTSGFLRRVFEIFSESKVSVDLISTSEANISVTVDAAEKIDKVVEQLSEFADVIVDDDKSQVSVIGKNIVRLNGMLKKTFAPLKRTNVYMISQGASFVNISFVVDREELKDVVKDLHYHLFEVEEELEQF